MDGDPPCVNRKITQLQASLQCVITGRGQSVVEEVCIPLLGALPLKLPQGVL